MDILEWAKKEIELACARERELSNNDENEYGYGCACYDSALRAFESLLGDGHSGFSIGITKNVLMSLIDGRPLTRIEDTPDVWSETPRSTDELTYQCKRMSSLFKKVASDGTVTYSDINRIRCVDLYDKSIWFYNGLVGNIIDEMYPISMPYTPSADPIVVVVEEFLVDPKNGDYDTMGILYISMKDGGRIKINRYFKDGNETMVEISESEYRERKAVSINGMN